MRKRSLTLFTCGLLLALFGSVETVRLLACDIYHLPSCSLGLQAVYAGWYSGFGAIGVPGSCSAIVGTDVSWITNLSFFNDPPLGSGVGFDISQNPGPLARQGVITLDCGQALILQSCVS